MKIVFTEGAWEDYLFWQMYDKKNSKKINQLIKECIRDPFDGIGKPEPLKFDFAGWWSRRIDAEHRLIYKIDKDKIVILQCRYHY